MNVRFDILVWLLVPLGATLLALLWLGWRARPKGPIDTHEGMAELVRFREAMAKPLPGLEPRGGQGDGDRDHRRERTGGAARHQTEDSDQGAA